jgi:hypothetical protein
VAELIRRGYVQVIFGGNAIITHDIESVLFGTSLGVDVESGEQVEGGHRHHLRAINTIRACGSVEQAIEAGLLKEGIVYEAIEHALAFGCPHLDGVLHSLHQLTAEPPAALRLPQAESASWQAIGNQPLDIQQYERLLSSSSEGVSHAAEHLA